METGETTDPLRYGSVSGPHLRTGSGVPSRLETGIGAAAHFSGETRTLHSLASGRLPWREFLDDAAALLHDIFKIIQLGWQKISEVLVSVFCHDHNVLVAEIQILTRNPDCWIDAEHLPRLQRFSRISTIVVYRQPNRMREHSPSLL